MSPRVRHGCPGGSCNRRDGCSSMEHFHQSLADTIRLPLTNELHSAQIRGLQDSANGKRLDSKLDKQHRVPSA